MAYYLELDGVDDYVAFPRISLSGDFKVLVDFVSSGTDAQRLLGEFGSFSNYISINAPLSEGVEVKVGSTIIGTFSTPRINNGLRHSLEVVRVGGDVTVFYDGTQLGSGTETRTFNIDRLGNYGSTSTFFLGDTYYFKVTSAGSVIHEYDFNDGAGTTLTDIVGTKDGTLTNFPTDDSQWVFYTPPATGPVTPINLSVTNILTTSARLNWEQG